MDLLSELQRLGEEHGNVRRYVMILGLKSYEEMHRPLATMEEREANLMVFHWFVRNGKQKEKLTIKLTHKETHESYCVKLAVCQSKLRVNRVYHRPDLNGKPYYIWPPEVTYANLTLDKIQQSVAEAELDDCVNSFLDDLTDQNSESSTNSGNASCM